MWKKEEEQSEPTQRTTAQPTGSAGRGASQATIGPSIRIDGDVTGSEDLLIQGQVNGSVTLKEHTVGVGKDGRVDADIVGRIITIEGRVEGDLTATEQIVLRGTAQVKGDIKAPRVVLEDGATFRGLVDMGAADSSHEANGRKGRSGSAEASASKDVPKAESSSSGASGSADGAGKDADDSKSSGSSSGKKTTQKAGA